MKALRTILYLILAAVVVGILVFSYQKTGSIDPKDLLKAGLVLVGIVISLLRPARKGVRGNKKAVYRKAYAEFIGTAFSSDRKLENKFFSAIDDFNRDRPAAALNKLTALRAQCTGTPELYAVTVFSALCNDDLHAYEAAAQLYDAALRIRPGSTLYSNLGLCYQRMGKFELSHRAFENAVALDSNNATAWNNLSSLFFKEGDYAQALRYAEESLKRNAALPQALSTAAVCCSLLGNEEGYQRYYRQAVANGYDGKKIKHAIAALSEDPQ